MKTIKCLFTALFLIMFGTKAFANLVVIIDGFLYSFSGTEAEVFQAPNCDDVIIPQSIDFDGITYTVTRIGDGAFQDCSYLKSVTIPNSVTFIGYSAFKGCKNLKNIIIPNSVTDIGDYLFYGCSHLTNVTLSNSLTRIGNSMFYQCFDLTNVTIPNSVTNIGNDAFYQCQQLTNVTIPNSVTNIGNRAFYECSRLKTVTIPNSITDIKSGTFYGTRIKSLTIGAGVRTISNNAFDGTIPIKTIWLTNTPPQNYQCAAGEINYVSNELYSSLSNKIVYPFLSSLFVVDGVKYVPVSPSDKTCDVIDCIYGEEATDINISETVSCKGIQMNVMKVNKYAFYDNTYINSVKLHINEETLADHVFHGCSSMITAEIGNSYNAIGSYAFDHCEKLGNITIPNNVTSIGTYAFHMCLEMSSVKIGSNVTIIDQFAFSNCRALTEIEIPQSVTTINNNVFEGCRGLRNFVISNRDAILNLGTNGSSPLFADCPLDSVYIGGNISYNTSPFYRSTSLRTVVITDKETIISAREFYGCTNLQNVEIGDGVEKFGDWAFSGCSSLKYFSFGRNVKKIGREAFSDCSAMERIISRSPQPPVCGQQALDDINKWNCVLTVPEGNIAAYQAADQWKEFFFIEEGKSVDAGIPEQIVDEQDLVRIYAPNGKQLQLLQKGLNIFIMQDGTSRKVVLK